MRKMKGIEDREKKEEERKQSTNQISRYDPYTPKISLCFTFPTSSPFLVSPGSTPHHRSPLVHRHGSSLRTALHPPSPPRAPSLRAAPLPALHLIRSLSSQQGGVASAAARSVLHGGGLLPVGLSSSPSSRQGACELAGASSTSSAASAPSQ